MIKLDGQKSNAAATATTAGKQQLPSTTRFALENDRLTN